MKHDTSVMYPWQNGGGKNRSDIDNTFIINAIIDNNRRLNKKTYFLFADAVKCFDNLWLQDCLVDLHELGMREREVAMIYEMNKQIKVVVDTPVGRTKEFTANHIVKQGSVCATKLCCASTGKVNLMSPQESYCLTPDINLQSVVFVDDILGGGTSNVVKGVEQNLQHLEEKKGFTFGTKKTNYMAINTGREKEEELDLKIKEGIIKKVSEYQCLGLLYHESGTIEQHLKSMTNKGISMIKDAARIGHPHHVGPMSTAVQLFLYEKVIVNSITHNLAGVTYWRKSDIESLEKVQGKLLKIILKLPDSTPYWGLLNELGLWPLEDIINYKKLMLLQNLRTSDDSRITKKLVAYQKEYKIEASWYVSVDEMGKQHAIQMENEELLENKTAWKKHIKEQIHHKVTEKSRGKINTMTKLRHQKQQSFTMQSYIQETNIWRVRDLIKVKLELLDIGKNYGKNRLCYGCKQSEETTEHIIVCKYAREFVGGECLANLDTMSDRKNLLQLYDFISTYIERRNATHLDETTNDQEAASRSPDTDTRRESRTIT